MWGMGFRGQGLGGLGYRDFKVQLTGCPNRQRTKNVDSAPLAVKTYALNTPSTLHTHIM